MPTPPTNTDTYVDLLGKLLTGWEEIRHALARIEELRRSGNGSARIDVTDQSTRSSVSVSLRTVAELEEYMKTRLRFTLLDGVRGTLTLEERDSASEVVVQGEVKLD